MISFSSTMLVILGIPLFWTSPYFEFYSMQIENIQNQIMQVENIQNQIMQIENIQNQIMQNENIQNQIMQNENNEF